MCVAAARFLVERGDVDPDRLAIEGGSAGGYTTLAALAFRDVFAAGISLFGDRRSRAARARHPQVRVALPATGWSARIPEAAERLPRALADPRLRPDLVPGPRPPGPRRPGRRRPPQAEAIVAALAANGIPYAYLAFEGEGHGFRGAVAIRRTLEARARRSSARSSASSRPTRSSRSSCPGSTPGANAGHRPRRPRARVARRRWSSARSSSSSACWCVAVGARLRRPPDRGGLPDPPAARRARARLSCPGLPVRSSSTPTWSSCCSCRRSCSGPATRRRSATSRPICAPIALLAVGLVLFTTLVVGLVAHAIMPFLLPAAAFALGAIVAPPDAVAATAIFRRLGRAASGRHDPRGREPGQRRDGADPLPVRGRGGADRARSRRPRPGLAFVVVGAGGILVGVIVGHRGHAAWRRTSDPTLEIMVSLLAPFAAYLPAEALGVSGVLATVVAGLIAGRTGGPHAVARGAADGRGRVEHRDRSRSTASRSC